MYRNHCGGGPPGPCVAMEINDNRTAVCEGLLVPLRALPSRVLPLADRESVPRRERERERERDVGR